MSFALVPKLEDIPSKKWINVCLWAFLREREAGIVGSKSLNVGVMLPQLEDAWEAFDASTQKNYGKLCDDYIFAAERVGPLLSNIASVNADTKHPVHDYSNPVAQRSELSGFLLETRTAISEYGVLISAIKALINAISTTSPRFTVFGYGFKLPEFAAGLQRDLTHHEGTDAHLRAIDRDVEEALEKCYALPGNNPFKIFDNPEFPERPKTRPDISRWELVPTPNKEAMWNYVMGGSIADAPRNPFTESPGQWALAVPGEKLAEGGQGTAALWANFDENWVMQRRVVRKDESTSFYDWTDPRRYKKISKGYYMPMEHLLALKCQLSRDAQTIVEHLHAECDIARGVTRIYTAYCQHGHLGRIGSHYMRAESTMEYNFTGPDGGKLLYPEPFLWYLFLCLAEAGLVLERGHIHQPPPPALAAGEIWTPIVHYDLKPGNIFLDVPANRFPHYPIPKIGDFGQAWQIPMADPENPDSYARRGGTKGYFAPELATYRDKRTEKPVDRFKLGSHTNVWQMGAIMLAIITNLASQWTQCTFIPSANEGPLDLQQTLAQHGREKYYSAELVEMIHRCLRFDPEQRPSFQQLYDRITLYVMGGFDNYGGAEMGRNSGSGAVRYNRDALLGNPIDEQEVERWRLDAWPRLSVKEEYKIGFQREPPTTGESD